MHKSQRSLLSTGSRLLLDPGVKTKLSLHPLQLSMTLSESVLDNLVYVITLNPAPLMNVRAVNTHSKKPDSLIALSSKGHLKRGHCCTICKVLKSRDVNHDIV